MNRGWASVLFPLGAIVVSIVLVFALFSCQKSQAEDHCATLNATPQRTSQYGGLCVDQSGRIVGDW